MEIWVATKFSTDHASARLYGLFDSKEKAVAVLKNLNPRETTIADEGDMVTFGGTLASGRGYAQAYSLEVNQVFDIET